MDFSPSVALAKKYLQTITLVSKQKVYFKWLEQKFEPITREVSIAQLVGEWMYKPNTNPHGYELGSYL
jgi:hypothetical protein